MTPLMVRSTAGRYVTASKEDVLRALAALLAQELPKGSLLDSPGATRRFIMDAYGARDSEVFCMITMDTRHRLIRVHELFYGTIDGASVHPREVVKTALQENASAVIFFHNHPSGVCDPSQADELITARLKGALALVDIRVLDHMIVGGGKIASFAERGLI